MLFINADINADINAYKACWVQNENKNQHPNYEYRVLSKYTGKYAACSDCADKCASALNLSVCL